MSESESFIEEVSEEVRRDKLFKLFRKYGWVLALLVLAIVGGTAYNEWSKARREAAARQNGDAMQAALDTGDAKALAPLSESGAPVAAVALLAQASLLQADGDTPGALAALRRVTVAADVPAAYTDLAWLKIIMLDGANMAENERNSAFERLTAAGAPYRLLALEQQAMQFVRDGDTAAATATLSAILGESALTPDLRNRAQQLLQALGGDAGALATANG